ncbi:MAG: cytochrome c oxidase subunit 3 [Pseudomonadota bacterium]|nr:cytochrome c oxidase subunit 3 [Pseudomonadota bacterium]
MATSSINSQPWHVPEPSPWPMVGTVAALSTAVGLIWFMHSNFPWLLLIGGILMIVTMVGWWRDVIAEGNDSESHTSPVKVGLRIGMLLFIASEVMFFFAFFWAYFHSSLPILNLVAGPWPNSGVEALGAAGIPMLNTLLLLTSSLTVTIAHHALLDNEREKVILWTGITVVLGVVFLGVQIYEYFVLAFGLKDGIYPSTFYLATGFHGFHVFVGTIFLIVCFFRAQTGHFTPEAHIGFEAAAWYWHFVDVVWIFLYINVYWWGSSAFGHLLAS